jgi:tRNA(Ile)-lysidine synthase
MVAEQTSPETILFELVRKYGFNATQAADMIRSRSHSGSIFKTITHQALINRGFLEVLEMRPKNDGLSCDTGCDCIISDVTDASQWPMSCDVSLIDKCDFAPIKGDVSTLYLDAAVLDNSPVWKLRRWQKGDKLKPFGMDGTRKLSDIFSDAKLSLIEKQNIKVLERNGEIIWVVGMRASRLYPVLSTTSRVLKITVHK